MPGAPALASPEAASPEAASPEAASPEAASPEERAPRPASIGAEQVQRLAERARLALGEEEAEALAGDVQRLLRCVQQLEEVDTAGVEPTTTGVLAETPPLRRDEPQKPLSQAEALEGAPDTADGFFRVPAR